MARAKSPNAPKPTTKEPLVLLVASEGDGYTYRLHPSSAKRVRELFPEARLFPRLFLAQDVKENFEQTHGPIAAQLVQLLTGLTVEQLKKQVGEIRFEASGKEEAVLFTYA